MRRNGDDGPEECRQDARSEERNGTVHGPHKDVSLNDGLRYTWSREIIMELKSCNHL